MSSSTPEAEALALFQAGRLDAAEGAWRAILARRPDDPEALHLLGIILARTGRREEGMALLDRSIAGAPRNAAFLNNRALVLSESGRLDEAERDLRSALQVEPRFVAGLVHIGSILRRRGRLEEATAAFRRALALDARSADAQVGLGNVLHARGAAAEARLAYAAALAVDPGHAGAHYNLGNLQLANGELAAAEAAFRAALAREPRHAQALNNLGGILRQSGRLEAARILLEDAVRFAPDNVEALTTLGLTLQNQGHTGKAVERFAAAVALQPAFAPALNNWGNALKEEGDLAGAAQRFDQAIAAAPGFADALNNRGNVALETGDADSAKRFYERALETRPGFVDARFSLAQVALRGQDFAAGWDGYELRFETAPAMATWRPPALPGFERADLGTPVRVAVWRERGVGDQRLFSTLLPALAGSGARPVIEMDARLASLYRRNLPAVEFVTPEESAAAFATCDRHLPLGSLPRLFRREAASFAAQPAALLRADPERVRAIRATLGPGRWIAVSWRSFQPRGRAHLARRKSMPVGALAGLAAPGVRLLDLQYGEVDAERAAFEAAHPRLLRRVEGLDTYNDFEGLLAAVEACEAVVTVSNVTAHLAGVNGRRGFVLFTGANSPFHYWDARRGRHSAWYPSLEIVTAASDGWEPLIHDVARQLAL